MDRHVFQTMREVEDHHWWFAGRRRILREVLTGLRLPAGVRVLDVGCGTGGNLPLLSRLGEVTGVEPHPAARALARGRGKGRIVDGALPDEVPGALGRFDLVVALDVLEHLEDDGAALRTLAGLTAPGGHLLVTVPAYMFLWSRHDVEHGHARRYTAPQLRQRIEQARLTIVRLTYYNTVLFPAIALARMAARWFPGAGLDAGLALPHRALNAALQAILSAERHAVVRSGLPFGVSLLALARRELG